jgi:hypothetical protein
MAVVASGLVIAIGWRFADAAFAAVFVWAFAGLAIRQSDARGLAITAWVVALIALGVAVRAVARSLADRRVPSLRSGVDTPM